MTAALLLAALSLRLLTQTAAAFGAASAWVPDNLRVIALESRWGNGWRPQMVAAMGMLGASLFVPARRAGWAAFDAATLALTLALPLVGHAAGSLPRHALHAAHGLSAGLWLGTLGVITLAAWSAHRPPGLDVAGLVRRFSPVALAGAVVALATGGAAAWTYAGPWASIATSPYGRLLAAKVTAVVAVVVCGWTNWRRARRNLPPDPTMITAEWLAAVLVLGLTGVLTETEHP
jgi:putative copper export protein